MRRRFGALVLAATALLARPLKAQLLGEPRLLLQPGLLTRDAVSVPDGQDAATGFFLRLFAEFPTQWRHVDVLLGTALAPIGLSDGRGSENAVAFYYGASFIPVRFSQTDGWLEFGIPVLGYFHYDEAWDAERLFVNDLALHASVTLQLGEKLLGDVGGWWSRLSVYAVMEQNLTPERDPDTGKRDPFAPAFHYGLSIPLGSRAR
jgi:hypothetical protein